MGGVKELSMRFKGEKAINKQVAAVDTSNAI
jgi:hypothetical protein